MENVKHKTRMPRMPLPPFQNGQIWQMEGSDLQIALVGKTLVHYKHYKGATKRVPVSLAAKKALEKYLRANKAILVQE